MDLAPLPHPLRLATGPTLARSQNNRYMVSLLVKPCLPFPTALTFQLEDPLFPSPKKYLPLGTLPLRQPHPNCPIPHQGRESYHPLHPPNSRPEICCPPKPPSPNNNILMFLNFPFTNYQVPLVRKTPFGTSHTFETLDGPTLL